MTLRMEILVVSWLSFKKNPSHYSLNSLCFKTKHNLLDVFLKQNEELLKDRLTPCREICPFLLDLFIWRKEAYPFIIAGAVTSFFMLLFYWQPSVLTALSVLGLLVTVADYVLPLVSKTVSSSEDWNSEKEKKFSIFVNRIAYYSVQVWNSQVMLEEWKKEHPNLVHTIN